MKKAMVISFAIAVIFAFTALALSGCPAEPETPPADQTPTAADFTVSGAGNVTYDGEPHAVTVTAKAGKTGGAITVKYDGSVTAPSKVAAYTVTFDVAAAAGWTAASGLAAGTLTIDADPEHNHSYPETWSYNATQHWHECACGEKSDTADHTGDPCGVCGYQTGNPAPCECNGIAEDCECADCDCDTCETPDVREPVITSHSASPASITVPAENSVQLNCTATSADGTATKSIVWSVEQAPQGASPQIDNANKVTGMTVAGTYRFKLVVTGNNDKTAIEYVTVNAGLNANVSFVSLGTFPATTIDFSPSTPLPAGVTYTLTDDKGTAPWKSADGFNGQITAVGYGDGFVTFTQTFHFNSAEITDVGSKRTVVINVDTFPFTEFVTLMSDSGPVTLQHPADPNAPAAHAGADQTATLAHDLTVTLDGTGSTGDITAYTWECASYTANQGAVQTPYTAAEVTALIANASKATATVAPRKAGTYVFKLTVTDDDSGSGTDTVTVVVEAYTVTQNNVSVATVSFVAGTELKLKVDSNNYSFVGGATDGF